MVRAAHCVLRLGVASDEWRVRSERTADCCCDISGDSSLNSTFCSERRRLDVGVIGGSEQPFATSKCGTRTL